MIIKTFVAGPIDANNYLVYDEKSKEAVLIDCSDYIQEIVNLVLSEKLNVKYILLTHGHFDHVLGLKKMKEILGAKVFVHFADKDMASNPVGFMQAFGMPAIGAENSEIDETLDDAGVMKLGDEQIKVFETPGHTRGCVCYLIGDKLFSGDTLFKGTVGRTDLPGGSFNEISHSVKDILFTLPDETQVYTGHGAPTTIADEKKFNDIVRY